MHKKISYALVNGVILVLSTGFASWVITGNISFLFEFFVFAWAFFISLFVSPSTKIEKD